MQFIRGCFTGGFGGRSSRLVVMLVMGGAVACGRGQTVNPTRAVNPAHGDVVTVNGAPGLSATHEDYLAMNSAPALSETAKADELPDAPEPQQQTKPDPDANKPMVAATPKVTSNTTMPMAPKFSKYIPAGYAVEQIHGREKMVIGTRDLISLGNISDWFLSAGWEHLWNSQPNYGTDRGAFGERLGAAAIRETTDGIFTDGVFDVMLHEDPRYFVQGSQFSFAHRVLYAASRPLITRSSNDGHAMPNYGLWLGLASSTALTNAYYPQKNRDFDDNWHRYVGSLAGSAGGYVWAEYKDDVLRIAHLKRGK